MCPPSNSFSLPVAVQCAKTWHDARCTPTFTDRKVISSAVSWTETLFVVHIVGESSALTTSRHKTLFESTLPTFDLQSASQEPKNALLFTNCFGKRHLVEYRRLQPRCCSGSTRRSMTRFCFERSPTSTMNIQSRNSAAAVR